MDRKKLVIGHVLSALVDGTNNLKANRSFSINKIHRTTSKNPLTRSFHSF